MTIIVIALFFYAFIFKTDYFECQNLLFFTPKQ